MSLILNRPHHLQPLPLVSPLLLSPSTIQEALSRPEWKKVVLEEMNALERNQTWKIVELPKDKPAVGCRWVFTPKFNANETQDRYKARLVTKGYT